MIKFVNNVKTAVLLGSLMGLCLLVGSFFGRQGLFIALIFGSLMNLVAFFFSDKIAIASMRGQEVTAGSPGVGGQLYAMVDELRQRAGLPMPRVYICPIDAPNAFATGRSPSSAAVAITEGALRLMSAEEVRGVMAHELAHVKNRDTLTSCVAAIIAGVLSYFAQFGLYFGGGRDREGGNPIFMLVAVLLAPLAAGVIKAMISRSREFVADNDGARIAGTPDGLISALQKLDGYSRRIPMPMHNPAMNNMFIIEPFAGMRTLANLFASHPPTQKRVEALLAARGEIVGR
jgi:heat shock protein HtpX